MVRVLSTREFDAWEKLLSRDHQQEINGIIRQLKHSWSIGKQLGYPFFKEKKFGKYRLYFLVYEKLDTVLLVTISDKKAQQDTIDAIKGDLNLYTAMIQKKI